MKYLFNYKEKPCPVSWRVEARDLQAARILLHFYLYLEDPFGFTIESKHIADNFQVMKEETEAEESINDRICHWGFSWLVEMAQ